ncbi:MAG: winged helix-turn-helix domain-containing protein [Pirellulales bacterium]
MAVGEMTGCTAIGDTAGKVWHYLQHNGPATMTQLAKAVDAPRDLVMQAVGWLAREDKIAIEEGSRSKVISLRSG